MAGLVRPNPNIIISLTFHLKPLFVDFSNLTIILIIGRGGKNRKKGKNENFNIKRELLFKEEDQEYAQVIATPIILKSDIKFPKVIRMLGNGRLES